MRRTKINKLIDYCTEYFIKETGYNIKVLKYLSEELMIVNRSKSKNNLFYIGYSNDIIDFRNYLKTTDGKIDKKVVKKTVNITFRNEKEYIVFMILHELGHVYEFLEGRSNNGKYNHQIRKSDIYDYKLLNKHGHMTPYDSYKSKLKYKGIEEERNADLFASKHYNQCLKYIENKQINKNY